MSVQQKRSYRSDTPLHAAKVKEVVSLDLVVDPDHSRSSSHSHTPSRKCSHDKQVQTQQQQQPQVTAQQDSAAPQQQHCSQERTCTACPHSHSFPQDLCSPARAGVPLGTSKTIRFGEGGCTCAKCMRNTAPSCIEGRIKVDAVSSILQDVMSENPTATREALNSDNMEEYARQLCTAVEQQALDDVDTYFRALAKLGDVHPEVASEFMVAAAQWGKAPLIELLIKYDGNVNQVEESNNATPLMYAASYGNTQAIKLLVQHDADIEARDVTGYTALMIAVFSDRATAAEALLKAGADIEAQDPRGRTALSFAAIHGSSDCLAVLAFYRADVYHKDSDGKTPLDLAQEQNRVHVVDHIKRLQTRCRLRQKRQRQKCQNSRGAAGEGLDVDEFNRRLAEANRAAVELIRQEELEQRVNKCKAKRKGKRRNAPQDATESHPHSHSHKDHLHGGECEELSLGKSPADSEKSENGGSTPGAEKAGGKKGREDAGDKRGSDGEVAPPIPTDAACLRSQFEGLLTEAATCTDPARQLELLRSIDTVIPACKARNISVKWAKKLLQRLEKVPTARVAIAAAIDARPFRWPDLQAALEEAKSVRQMLPLEFLTRAEECVARGQREERDELLHQMASKLRLEAESGATAEDLECVVCMERMRSCCVLPCWHVCMCMVCATNVQKQSGLCPMCRTPVQEIHQLTAL